MADTEVCDGCTYESLTEALAAFPSTEPLRVTVAEGAYTEPRTVVLSGRSLEVVTELGASVSISSAGAGPVFKLESAATLTLVDISAVKVGGRVFEATGRSQLDVQGGVFYAIGLVDQGGVLRADDDSSVDLRGARFLSSISTGDGGMLWVEGVTLTVVDSTFVGGFGRRGGAVWIDGGGRPATFEGCVFDGNESSNEGGAIGTVGAGPLIVTGSRFVDNRAGRGGAIAAFGEDNAQPTSVSTSEFVENRAEEVGGALLIEGRAATVAASTFVGNSAVQGGALGLLQGTAELTETTFCQNSAEETGGAVFLDTPQEQDWLHDSFVDNHAVTGGAIGVTPDGLLRLSFSSLLGNTADTGAAVYVSQVFESTPPLVGEGLVVGWSGGDAAIVVGFGGAGDIRSSVFYLNTEGNFRGPDESDNTQADPKLRGYAPGQTCASLDERYPPQSPLRDPPSINGTDPDGTSADIGRWGGYGRNPAALPEPWLDRDNDGVVGLYDCEPGDPSIYPPLGGAPSPEIWYDGIDQDCDGGSDFDQDRDGVDLADEFPCSDEEGLDYPGAVDEPKRDRNCDGEIDADQDGVPQPTDCHDDDPNSFPGAIEDLDDTYDADCDGFPDRPGVLVPRRCDTVQGALPVAGPWAGFAALVALARRARRPKAEPGS